jgi:hypothetical protein
MPMRYNFIIDAWALCLYKCNYSHNEAGLDKHPAFFQEADNHADIQENALQSSCSLANSFKWHNLRIAVYIGCRHGGIFARSRC